MNTTVSAVKTRARALMSHLAKSGKSVTLSEALEAISATDNGSDWNRYQAALKKNRNAPQAPAESKEYQPHKVLACYSSNEVPRMAEAIFAHEADNGKIPVIVLLEDIPFPQNLMANDAGWITVEVKLAKDSTVHMPVLNYAEDIKGIIIKPITNWHEMAPDLARSLCMKHLLSFIPEWSEELIKRLGTIIFYGLHLAESSYVDYYETKLPEFMQKIRSTAGDQQLLVVTHSDKNKNFMAMSNDDYKIIVTENADSKLFNIHGIERLVIPKAHGNSSPAYRFPRLFRRKHLLIEDICIYVGSMSQDLINLPAHNYVYASIRRYVLQTIHCETLTKDRFIEDDFAWNKRAISMYKAILQTLVYLERRGDLTITEACIKAHSGLNECYKLYANENTPKHAKEKLYQWLLHLPGFDFSSAKKGEISEECNRQHSYVAVQYSRVINEKLLTIQ